jgi:hypothetical protein
MSSLKFRVRVQRKVREQDRGVSIWKLVKIQTFGKEEDHAQ